MQMGQTPAGWANLKGPAQMGGMVPGGNQFQFFPTQVGGPTPYARSRRLLFIGIVVYQLLMGIMALVEFMNFLSGILMIMGTMTAVLALKEDMNITYVCWWGVMSTVGFVAGVVGALIGFAVKISTIIIKFNIPLSCFFGMMMAWWLYTDYEAEHPESNDMVASWLRAFGLLKPKQVQANPGAFPQLPQFGTGNLDAIKGGAMAGVAGAGAYGAMGQEKFAAAQEGGFASSVFGKQPASAPQVAAPMQGPGDLRRDPFLTH